MKLKETLLLLSATVLFSTITSVFAQDTTISESTSSNNLVASIEYFTERDLDASYDQATATQINLNGDTATIEGAGVTLENNTLRITQEGVYVFSGSSENLQILVEVTDTEKVQIVLNNVSMSHVEPPIYINTGDKVFITVLEGTTNSLTDGTSRTDESIDAVIFSRSDLTINGSGILNLNGQFNNGIESKDDLKIVNATVSVNAVNHTLKANDTINIEGATLDLTAGKDGIHAENDEDITLGNVYLNPKSLIIQAVEDGVDAFNLLEIVDGEITITQSEEGMEASVIHQTGGNVSITSSDDGLNASDGSSSSEPGFGMQGGNSALQIIIDGGTLFIDVEGDVIDSNGSITINGGDIYVEGSTMGGNGAIDSDGGVTLNGGSIIALGTADMPQGFTSDNGQASIMANISGNAGSTITISDISGNVVTSYTSTKSFQLVQASVATMTDGETYVVNVDGNEVNATATTQAQGMSLPGMPGRP